MQCVADRLAGQGKPPAEGDKPHEVVSTDAALLHGRMMAQLRQMPYEIIVDLRTRIGLADDEVLISKIVPTDLFTLGQDVISGDDHENTLIPKTGPVAAIGSRFAREKGDIHAVMLNGSNVFRRATFDKT
jgi:hypothetical protein